MSVRVPIKMVLIHFATTKMISPKDYEPNLPSLPVLQSVSPAHMCSRYMSANHLMDKTEKANGNAFEIMNEQKCPMETERKAFPIQS